MELLLNTVGFVSIAVLLSLYTLNSIVPDGFKELFFKRLGLKDWVFIIFNCIGLAAYIVFA